MASSGPLATDPSLARLGMHGTVLTSSQIRFALIMFLSLTTTRLSLVVYLSRSRIPVQRTAQ